MWITWRIIHLEVFLSMITSSCVMGIERFISQRGRRAGSLSDNETDFVSSENEIVLRKLISTTKLKKTN